MSFPPLAPFSGSSDVVSGEKAAPPAPGAAPCPASRAAPAEGRPWHRAAPGERCRTCQPCPPAVPAAVSPSHAPLWSPYLQRCPAAAPGSAALLPPPRDCCHPSCPTRDRGDSPGHTSAGTRPPPLLPGSARPGSPPLPGFIVSLQTNPSCCGRSRSRGIRPGSGTR